MEIKIKQRKSIFWHLWRLPFPNAPLNKVFFPYRGDTILYPKGLKPPQDIIEHEKVHLESQRKLGYIRWLWKYITDRKFRYEEELQGYLEQIKAQPRVIRKHKMDDLIEQTASIISSKLYNNIVNFEKAEQDLQELVDNSS